MKPFITRWTALTIRERQFIAIGLLSIFILMGYELIWAPLQTTAQRLSEQMSEDEKILGWMQAADQLLGPPTPSTPSISLLNLLQTESHRTGFDSKITSFKQTNHGVQITVQSIPFDELIQWIMTLSRKQNVFVSQFSVTREREEGLVRGEITFD